LTPNVSDGGSCRTPDLGLNQSTTPDRPDRLEISAIPPMITSNKETVEMDFGPSSALDRPALDRPAETSQAEPSKEPDQTSLVKTPVNSICDFSVGEEPAEKEPFEIIKMTDDVIENEESEPVIIKMTDDIIESEDGSDDVIDDIITIPVEDMGVKNEIFDMRMTQNQMTQKQMNHNQMSHSQMTHNQIIESLRQKAQFSINNDSKRKFNGAQFQNQRSVQASDWSLPMKKNLPPEASPLQFKPIDTPESRLSSSSFSSGLPSSIDFDRPGSPPASLDGFTTYVINQENYHRNELILNYLKGKTLV